MIILWIIWWSVSIIIGLLKCHIWIFLWKIKTFGNRMHTVGCSIIHPTPYCDVEPWQLKYHLWTFLWKIKTLGNMILHIAHGRLLNYSLAWSFQPRGRALREAYFNFRDENFFLSFFQWSGQELEFLSFHLRLREEDEKFLKILFPCFSTDISKKAGDFSN